MAVPTTQEVRAWCQISAASLTDAQLQQVMDAELASQALTCRWPALADDPNTPDPDAYSPLLAQSLYRRVARQVAGRGVPLGLVADPASESGALMLATFDSEVERLEGPLRLVVFG